MEERDMIELYFERNELAIAETAKKYGKLCYGIAYRILGDAGDAEECVNDTYHGLWRAIPPARPSSLCAFAARIARNLAIGKLRYRTSAKRRPDALLSLEELEEIIPDSLAEQHEDGEVGAWISEFLVLEDEETRNIFIRKYWFFDSIATLASRYGYSDAKIKSILFRTRNRLREYLGEKGVKV